jgi:membrane-associated protease RseP (regulator of RpoE activity)
MAGCGAVYPELSAPVRAAPAGATLSPPPPNDMLYLAFEGAEIPTKTRDGRRWDSIGGAAPDPFAKLSIGDKELLRTPVQSNTLAPTWPDAVRGNYRIPIGSSLELELWDSNALTNHPICVKTLRRIHDEANAGAVDIQCDSGARIRLKVEPAHAEIGLGFHYELRTQEVYVTRVVLESPAGRLGIKAGDQLLKIEGKDVAKMSEGEPQSAINANARTGVSLTVRHADGRVEDISLKEGPIYRTLNDSASN